MESEQPELLETRKRQAVLLREKGNLESQKEQVHKMMMKEMETETVMRKEKAMEMNGCENEMEMALVHVAVN